MKWNKRKSNYFNKKKGWNSPILNLLKKIIKKIEINYYTFKGFDIYEAIHPMLYGKYEIYKDEIFIARALNLKDVRKIIKQTEKK